MIVLGNLGLEGGINPRVAWVGRNQGKLSMNLNRLVDAELALYDWSNLAEADGPSTAIPAAFMELLSAESPAASTKAYWKLENHVVSKAAYLKFPSQR